MEHDTKQLLGLFGGWIVFAICFSWFAGFIIMGVRPFDYPLFFGVLVVFMVVALFILLISYKSVLKEYKK